MDVFDNGGAFAIKGFNYQKSVVMLIAVLHLLDTDEFKLAVETKDDIVVTLGANTTYIQAKSSNLDVAYITRKTKGKDSILEKNVASGSEISDSYKLVTPVFKDSDKNLIAIKGDVISQGARIYSYSESGKEQIRKKLPSINQGKLDKSKVAITLFSEDQNEALNQIQGVMTSVGIPVDNGHGLRSLDELGRQVDRRSAIIVKQPEDVQLKSFTKKDLSAIFTHSHKKELIEKILTKLNYNTVKTNALLNAMVSIGALYDSQHTDVKRFIKKLDIYELTDDEIVKTALESIKFPGIKSALIREAIVIDAYGQIIYEDKYL